jgi:2-oxoglutarate dehydrogenase E2 component (dihydrolipoamide succinyltransferase)
MVHEVRVPQLGESISEGVIVAWLKEDGALVEIDAPILELETDKVTMEIAAPQAGRLSIKEPVQATVKVGQLVATIDDAAVAAPPAQAAPAPPPVPPIAPPAGLAQAAAKIEAASRGGDAADRLSPAVRRLVTEHRLDAATIDASGPGGRITKEDVLKHLERAAPPEPTAPAAPSPAPATTPPPAAAPAPPPGGAAPRQTRQKMTKLRARIAERLLQSQSTTATLTTFNEADLSRVIEWRARHKERFQEKHGVGLGFMSFFVKASVEALRTVPRLNAQIDGDEIVQNNFYDISVAVSTDHGLVVPVIRDCDTISFAEIERRIADVARRARERKLVLEELSGGCFTVSNGGIYGSMLSTPILNPPQSGILGLHAIKKRPIAVGDEVVVRPMMYLAMSYDHRLVDGAEAVTFLKRIVECVENPERMMLEV